MNPLQKLWATVAGRLSGKSSRTYRLTDRSDTYYDKYSPFRYFFFTGLQYDYNDRNFRTFLWEAYGKNPFVYMVVHWIAKIGSTLPYKFYNEAGEEVPQGAQLRAVMDYLKKPSPMYSKQEMLYKLLSNYEVNGNAIVYRERIPGFAESERPLCVAYLPDVEINTAGEEGTMPVSYSINGQIYLPSEVCHFKKPNILKQSDWGLSPLFAGQYAWEASGKTFEASAAIHDNRGVSGLLTPKDSSMPLRPGDQEKLQAEWNARTAGAHKFGEVHITTQAMDYTAVGMTPADLRLIEQNIEYLRYICSIYGLDSSLFNDPANKTYNNRKEAEKAAYTDVVLPLMQMVYEKLSDWLFPEFNLSGYEMRVDKKAIALLNEPDGFLSQKVVNEVQAGILTPEEARAILYPELS